MSEECRTLMLMNSAQNDPFNQENSLLSTKVPYIGLSNQGATCYMNSLLQTLFMNPEFRDGIYNWQYNKDIHGKEEDCIPLQLQKLFARLQLKIDRFVDTRDLTKSFQWNAGESFEQQDIQEFCRVLFDVIEQTCKKSKAENMISDLYEGNSVNYVRCIECGYESRREESFLDICLTVKNKIDKIYNDSLEKALQTYLKPELLDGDNKYSCETCNKKVTAKRGAEFLKLPKYLCLILNRFSFDYYSMKRIKLEDFVSFPFILNMNDYLNGYDNIKNKQPEDSNESYFISDEPIRKKSTTIQSNPIRFIKPKSSVLAKKQKPQQTSNQTKDFLKEMRQKNKNTEKKIDVVIYTTSEEFKNQDINQNNSNCMEIETIEQENKPIPLPPPIDLSKPNPPPKRINYDLEEECINNDPDSSTLKSDLIEYESKLQQQKNIEDQEKKRAENLVKLKEESDKLIEKYLLDGPFVYELYSILIHSGGAYGGHYYNYTKSYEDGKWYCFDDSNVKEIDVEDIPNRAFGGGNRTATGYMLMYRKIGEKIEKINGIPENIKIILDKEKEEKNKIYEQKQELLKNITIKIYYKLEVRNIKIRITNSYQELLEKTIEYYNLQEIDIKNCRLRDYLTNTDTLLDSYEGKELKTLEELHIYNNKTMALEIKKTNEVFKSYDPNQTTIRIVLWTPEMLEIEDLNEINQRIIKLSCFKTDKLKDILEKISTCYKINIDELAIIKKIITSGISVAHLLSTPENLEKTLFQLVLVENIILYIEKKDPNIVFDPIRSHWQSEFEKEANKILIKFNNPDLKLSQDTEEYSFSVIIDSRLTLLDLKQRISEVINIPIEELLMKRGGKLGVELKDMNSIICTQHFINGSSVYLERGTPSKPGQYRILFYLAKKTNLLDDQFFYNFEDLFELPIPGEWTVSKVKKFVVEQCKEQKNIELNFEKTRLRERNSEKLTRIYREMPMITQQIYERRMMAIEEIENNEIIGFKDILLVIRIWDSQKWCLSERFEIFIKKDMSLKEVGEEIYKVNNSIEVCNMVGCRILSIMRFNPFNLIYEEWHEMGSDEFTANMHPFYLNTDGFLLIIKDNSIPVRELTEEEVKKYGINAYSSNNNRVKFKNDNKTISKPLEKALKITIKQKSDEKIEENKENKD